MNREIKFRALKIDKTGWVYGVPIFSEEEDYVCYIHTETKDDCIYYETMAIAKTVGEYTGLKDSKGVKIFEGDIVKSKHFLDKRKKINGEVKFIKGGFLIDFTDIEIILTIMESDEMEVIGNIYENKKLLEDNNGKDKKKIPKHN